MTPKSLHDKAMDLADQAVAAERRGWRRRAEECYRQAMTLEQEAAELVPAGPDAEPSRSVLFRSAASLAIDCREFRHAERLIAIALAGYPPEEICDELRDLLESVHFSRHLDLRGIELQSGELQMSLVGNAVGFGLIDSAVFLRKTEMLDALLVRTAQRKKRMPFTEHRRNLRDFPVYLSTSRAASFAVTVRLGKPRQLTLPGFTGPDSVVEETLSCLVAFNAGNRDELEQRIGDEAYFNNFVALARKLAPDGEKIKGVGFTATEGRHERRVALTSIPGEVWTKQPEPDELIEEFTGIVARADALSQKRHTLSVELDDGKVKNIAVRVGELNDIVKPHWGERVTVKVLHQKGGQLDLLEIAPVEENPDETAEKN